MRTPLIPASALGVDFKEDPNSSRPPDAAIRANVELMQAGMASLNQLMMAAAPHGGLQIVVSGNNPSVARAPEKISGVNADVLSAVGQGAAKALETTASQKTAEQKVAEPTPTVASQSSPILESVTSSSFSTSTSSDAAPLEQKAKKKEKSENKTKPGDMAYRSGTTLMMVPD